MALIKDDDNRYLRVLVKDTGPVNFENKKFVLEIWKDSATRDSHGEFDKAKYEPISLAGNWDLVIEGSTSMDDISAEAYRCLKLNPSYSTGWSDDI